MSNKVNLSEFSDSIIAFLDYGVRAWLPGIPFIILLMLLETEGVISLNFTAIAMIVTLVTMAFVWFNDVSKGYVPRFWLRLSYTKQFWTDKKPLSKRV